MTKKRTSKMIGFHPKPDVRRLIMRQAREKDLPMSRVINDGLRVALSPVMEMDCPSKDSPM